MSYQRERGQEEAPLYATGYQEMPGFNGYAAGFGASAGGQKLQGPFNKTPSASQRLLLAIVSLVLWVVTLFGLIGIAIAARADDMAGVYILLGMAIFSTLITLINIVYNRGDTR